MSTTSNLGKVSTFMFLTGFVFGKIQYLPIPVVSTVFNVISLVFYMMGYSIWFISSHYHPTNTQKPEWYGFAQFKEQHLFAAALGLLATTVSIAALFAPVLLIPAAWLFFASNFMWTIGEYHKLNNPFPNDKGYSHSYQKAYLSYAITMTATSTVAALTVTLVCIFPLFTLPILITSAIVVLGLSALAAEIWMDYTFGDHKPTPIIPNSHHQMNQTLGAGIQLEIDASAPYHGHSPVNTNKEKHSPKLELEIDSPPDSPTCPMTY